MKSGIHYKTALIFLAVWLSASFGSELAYGPYSVSVSQKPKGIQIYMDGKAVLLLQPESGSSLPEILKSTVSETGIDFSGKAGGEIFSGKIRKGKALQFFLRFYPESEPAPGRSGVLVTALGPEQKGENAGINLPEGYRLIAGPSFEKRTGGGFIPPSPIHITSSPSSYISFSIVPEQASLPLLNSDPVPFENVDRYEMTESRIFPVTETENPFTTQAFSCEIKTPSGKSKTIHPFFTRDFKIENKQLTETGFPHYAFRFSPTEVGPYSYVIRVGKKVVYEGIFASAPTESKGFIRFSGKSRFFTYSDGDIFFPIGINLCWADDMFKYMDALSENGINFMRLWLCTWGYNVEGEFVNDFRLDVCSRLDQLFEYAKKKNIRVMLCLNNFYDFKYNKYLHGYYRDGAICKTDEDFFKKKEALQAREVFIRYLVNRYSAYTSLAAWETWNEVDYAISPDYNKISELEKFPTSVLNFADPYGRPVSSSLGVFRVDYDLWDLNNIAFVQYHVYIPKYNVLPRNSEYGDSAYLIKREKTLFNKYTKPVLLSEFGFNGTNEDNPNNDLDPDGVMLHNSIWASTLTGWSGTAMHWWWDVYIEKNDLFYLYKPLSTALSRFRFTQQTETFGSEKIRNSRIRVMGVKNRTSSLFWVQDKKATWEQMKLYNYVPQKQEGVKLRVGTFDEGDYTAEWIDTFTGEIVKTEKVKTEKNYLIVHAPDFERDIACVIGKKVISDQ